MIKYLKKLDLKYILGALFLALFLAVFYNSLSPGGIDFVREKIEFVKLEDPDTAARYDTNNRAPKLISLERAVALFGEEGIKFIDARDKWDFAEGHIKGAINLPEHSIELNLDKLVNLPKNHTYVIYCGDPDCEVSGRLALKFSKFGFSNVLIFEGGWIDWNEKGLPTEKGEMP